MSLRPFTSAYNRNLWIPNGTEAPKVRKLALRLDAGDQPSGSAPFHFHQARDDRFQHFTNLESLTLILVTRYQVVNFKVDEKNLLTEGEWAFSMDVESEEFKEYLVR
jgi:hypothetical protein